MSDTRTVTFKVLREETWYPEYEVPANLDDDEALEYIHNERPDQVFDEMSNKYTLDTNVNVKILENQTMNTYTEPQKIDLVSQGMQRIEDTLRYAVECIGDAGERNKAEIANSLKEALTICELMNPNNHTQGE